MNTKSENTDYQSWLAAEYALGVLNAPRKAEAEALYASDQKFRQEVDHWNEQLSPLLNEVEGVQPPVKVWKGIQREVAPASSRYSSNANDVGIWKLLTALSSSAAVAAIGVMMFVTGGDFTVAKTEKLNQQIADLKQEAVVSADKLVKVETELDESRNAAEKLKEQLLSANTEIDATNAQLVEVSERARVQLEEYRNSTPLVASLTKEGEAPAFVAQYDPVGKQLFIRAALDDTQDQKVPEVWLIPDDGPRKGDAISLGVMDENGPARLKLSGENIDFVNEGGLLAITLEPPGGAPDGVATGAIIALGTLQGL